MADFPIAYPDIDDEEDDDGTDEEDERASYNGGRYDSRREGNGIGRL